MKPILSGPENDHLVIYYLIICMASAPVQPKEEKEKGRERQREREREERKKEREEGLREDSKNLIWLAVLFHLFTFVPPSPSIH